MNKIKVKRDAEKLRQWLNTIPVGDYRPIIARIVAECKIESYTFNNWRHGLCRIPQLYKDKIEEVAGCEIFDSETIKKS